MFPSRASRPFRSLSNEKLTQHGNLRGFGRLGHRRLWREVERQRALSFFSALSPSLSLCMYHFYCCDYLSSLSSRIFLSYLYSSFLSFLSFLHYRVYVLLNLTYFCVLLLEGLLGNNNKRFQSVSQSVSVVSRDASRSNGKIQKATPDAPRQSLRFGPTPRGPSLYDTHAGNCCPRPFAASSLTENTACATFPSMIGRILLPGCRHCSHGTAARTSIIIRRTGARQRASIRRTRIRADSTTPSASRSSRVATDDVEYDEGHRRQRHVRRDTCVIRERTRRYTRATLRGAERPASERANFECALPPL